MWRQSSENTRWLRVVAALVLMALGAGFLVSGRLPVTLIGLAPVLTGLVVIAREGVSWWRERSDPYDLSKLFDTPPPPPEEPEEDNKFRNTILCHRCGTSLPESYSICTVCGNRLGS